jgi:hypothetical protein
MMRNPLEYYKEQVEQIINQTTNTLALSTQNLTDEEIVERNNFIMDFILKQ